VQSLAGIGSVLTLGAASACAQGVAGVWETLAGDSARSGFAHGGDPAWGSSTGDLGPALWTASADSAGRPIAFVGQAGVVADHSRVYTTGSVAGSPSREWLLLAFDRRTGVCSWSRPIQSPSLESFATPTLVPEEGLCLVVSGSELVATDCLTGAVRFRTPVARPLVNISPAIDVSRWGRFRAFVTDYDGFGVSGRLYCINLSPRLAPLNSFDPGEVVWSVEVGGTSGNSPAVSGEMVYVSTIGEAGLSPGRVLCFDSRSVLPPAPRWVFENVMNEGFFGGVTVSGGAVYAASYAFSGGLAGSNLVKLDAATGAMIWTAPCNRTASTPIPLPAATGRSFPRLALSGGVQGFGTVPTLEVFEDRGTTAAMVWNSATATYSDGNGNGRMDPGEYVSIGGWSHTPALIRDPAGLPGASRVLIGTLPTSGGTSAAGVSLRLVDLTGPSGLILNATGGAGGTPALAGRSIYSIGAGGLVAYGAVPARTDVNSDGLIDEEDLFAWDAGLGQRDADGNGTVNATDRVLVERDARREE